jgi:hypothetical protein
MVAATPIETAVKTNTIAKETVSKPKKTTKKIFKPVISVPVLKQEAIVPELVPQQNTTKAEVPPITNATIASADIKADGATEKKKGFGLFRGLFHKKKKNDQKTDETEQLNN